MSETLTAAEARDLMRALDDKRAVDGPLSLELEYLRRKLHEMLDPTTAPTDAR